MVGLREYSLRIRRVAYPAWAEEFVKAPGMVVYSRSFSPQDVLWSGGGRLSCRVREVSTSAFQPLPGHNVSSFP